VLLRGDGPFFQDLYYLSGLETYNSALLFDLATGEEEVFVWGAEYHEAVSQTDVGHVVRCDNPVDGLLNGVLRRSPRLVFLGACGAGLSTFAVELNHVCCGSCRIENAEALIAPLRRIKDSWELECLRKAQAVGGELMRRAIDSLRPGVSEREVAAQIVAGLTMAGSRRPSTPIVAFGDHTVKTHHVPTGRRMRPGDVVLVDIFGEACYQYCVDIAQTLVIGGENEQAAKRIDVVTQVFDDLAERARPGVTPAELEIHARHRFEAAGFPGEYPGSCVHDVGLSEHDPTAKDEPLRPGRVIAVEPGLYNLSMAIGVRAERMVEITASPRGDSNHE